MNNRKVSTKLSILLALVLCLGILPVVAFAADTGTADDSVDTSATQVIGILETDRETYENTASIHEDPAWTTSDEGETYRKLVYNSGKQKVYYSNPCPEYIQGMIDAAKAAVDASGEEYAARPNLSYAGSDTASSDHLTDNRAYKWFYGGDSEGPYPGLADNTARYMVISGEYGRERVYRITGVINSSSAANTQDIAFVEVFDIQEPVAGEEANLGMPTLPTDANYGESVDYEWLEHDFPINHFLDLIDPESGGWKDGVGCYLPPSDSFVFQEGKYYTYRVELSANPDYRFAPVDDMSGMINGEEARLTGAGCEIGEVALYRTFGPAHTHSGVFVPESPGDDTPATPGDENPDTDIPQTGDNSHMLLWGVLLLISGTGVAITTVYVRKKRTAR